MENSSQQWQESFKFNTLQKVWTFDLGIFSVQILDWELYPLNFEVSCPHLQINEELNVNSLEEAQKEALEIVDFSLRRLRLKIRSHASIPMGVLRQQQKDFAYGDRVRIPGCTDIYSVEQNRGDTTFVSTGHVSTEMVTASLELVEKDKK